MRESSMDEWVNLFCLYLELKTIELLYKLFKPKEEV